MAFVGDRHMWALDTFGACDLGDTRRLERLIEIAAHQAADPLASINALFGGDAAGTEGAYKFFRNRNVEAADIDKGYWKGVAKKVEQRDLVVVIQDTTTLRYDHRAREELGDIGGGNKTKARGYIVHSSLAVDANTGDPIGLLDQDRAIRRSKRPGRESRKKRAYQNKESFKWQAASERWRHRLERTDNVIELTDREGDIFDYFEYKLGNGARYVARSCYDRRLDDGSCLLETLYNQPVLGVRAVKVSQRGPQHGSKNHQARQARVERTARVEIRSSQVSLSPGDRGKNGGKPLTMWAVLATEAGQPHGCTPIEWCLLTTEQAGSFATANWVVRLYELRWLIEEFHKAWKSGCAAERRTLDAANLDRLNATLAPQAVRLLQLRTAAAKDGDQPSESVLEPDEVHCLRELMRRRGKLPEQLTARWAMESIAKLGGWRDTGRTGRIGWQTMWRGWMRFQLSVDGWVLARSVRG